MKTLKKWGIAFLGSVCMWVFLVMGTQKNREGTRISCQVCWSTTAVATAESHTDCPRGVSSFFGYSNVLASLFVSSTF